MKRSIQHHYTLWATAIIISTLFSCTQKRYKDALTPQESMATFQLPNDLTIELVAAEPLVNAPVSMLFNEQGDMYVIEMEDYPYKADSLKGKGIIKALFDTDKDGKMDSAVR